MIVMCGLPVDVDEDLVPFAIRDPQSLLRSLGRMASAPTCCFGADLPVRPTRRTARVISEARDVNIDTVHPGGTVIIRKGDDIR